MSGLDPNVPLWLGTGFVDGRELWTNYKWLAVVGGLVSFAMAWAIGANDVANSFGTTVGAKTITLWQACIIAGIFEFVGAVALGGEVAKTVAGGITDPKYFLQEPEAFAFGMLCSLIAAWFWVTLATIFEMPVSTTHSIIGAVIGFGLVYGGATVVNFRTEIDTFPYYSGLVTIIISWFSSPGISGGFAAILFFGNRTFVLRRENSTVKALYALPILVLITVFINIFFVLYKGAKNELKWDDKKAAWVSICAAGGAAIACIPLSLWLKKKTDALAHAEANPESVVEVTKGKDDAEAPAETASNSDASDANKNVFAKMGNKIKNQLVYSLTVDVHEDVDKDEGVAAMHANAEIFNPHTEYIYKYLQVFSACCVAFAHGSNDVANAIGPFSGIWYVYNNHAVNSKAPTPKWILVLGGAGIVIGLGTYGYNIIKVIGVKMAKMTPSRGYCAELGAALTISICSVYGLPVSTTHCIVGAEVGVGLVDSVAHGPNWKLFGRTFAGWIATIIVAALFSALIFSFGSYAPSAIDLNDVAYFRNLVNEAITNQTLILNQTNVANNNSAILGPQFYVKSLETSLKAVKANASILSTSYKFKPHKEMIGALFRGSNVMFNALNTPTVGFSKAGMTNSTSGIVIPAL